jgi:nucleoside-diphosphate-sugar epimerase
VVDNLVVGRIDFVHSDASFQHHDITGSEEYLARLFQKFFASNARPGFVFNYAAYPYIPVSFERPLHVVNVNTMGALKVINAAQESGACAILQVSSAEIYGTHPAELDPRRRTPDGMKISEDDIVLPHSSYGAAKATIDAMVQVRWREARCPVLALRQFNCVGERETHPYVIPEIISQLSKWELEHLPSEDTVPQVQLGNNSFRDFQYAGDAVQMATELLEKGEFGEVYNMGSERGIKVYDLAKEIAIAMGFASVNVIEDDTRRRPWEIWHLQSNNAKLYRTIKRRSTTSLADALNKTVRWYTSNNCQWPWEQRGCRDGISLLPFAGSHS